MSSVLIQGVKIRTPDGWTRLTLSRSTFPRRLRRGISPLNGKDATRLYSDSGDTKKTLGILFASFEEQVGSVGGHYLDIEELAQGVMKIRRGLQF